MASLLMDSEDNEGLTTSSSSSKSLMGMGGSGKVLVDGRPGHSARGGQLLPQIPPQVLPQVPSHVQQPLYDINNGFPPPVGTQEGGLTDSGHDEGDEGLNQGLVPTTQGLDLMDAAAVAAAAATTEIGGIISANTTLNISVPDYLIGSIFGRGATVLYEIMTLSGAHIVVSPRPPLQSQVER